MAAAAGTDPLESGGGQGPRQVPMMVEMREMIQTDIARWCSVIARRGIQIQN